eukprot:TRINITY_DN3183_c0_g1_i2.p1 TRINITY_DN3183_c0_g1~~TRINITY_DN3183_c0_g1_i2.p1  ORF type:complete len:462 (+),score=89.44 TRINITY_DN3183_c0_g1_i2:183-1568(+)
MATRAMEEHCLPILLDEHQDTEATAKETAKDNECPDIEEAELSSTSTTGINLVNTLVGAGLLSIPFSIRASGFCGVFLFAMVTSVLGWTLVTLLTTGAMNAPRTQQVLKESSASFPDYSILARAAWGRRGEMVAIATLFCELWLGLISYLILIGLNVEAALPAVPKWTVILGCGISGGLMALLHLNKLAYFAGIALFITAGSCTIMVASGALIPGNDLTSSVRHYNFINPRGLPESLGLIFFTFAGFPIFPKLYANMKSKPRFPQVVTCSFSAIFILYAGLGAAGYYLFGNYTQESFTQNVGRHLDGERVDSQRWMALFVGLGMSLNKLLTSPLLLMAVGDGVMNVCGWSGARTHQMVVAVLCAVATSLAILLQDHFAAFTSLVGSVATVTASLLLPIGFYVALVLPTFQGTRVERYGVMAMLVLTALLGVLCAVIGTISAVCSMTSKTEGICSFTSGWRN